MRKFEFRLRRVLEYREMQEGWAKDAYLEAKALRIKAQAELDEMISRKEHAADKPEESIEYRRGLELYLSRLENEIEEQRSVISILEDEEEKARTTWLEIKQKLEALMKLHDIAEAEWKKQAEAEEQKELDEWSTRKRDAA